MCCSVTVELIILSNTDGRPLSGSQAIEVLTTSQSLSALMSAGLSATEFVTSGKK